MCISKKRCSEPQSGGGARGGFFRVRREFCDGFPYETQGSYRCPFFLLVFKSIGKKRTSVLTTLCFIWASVVFRATDGSRMEHPRTNAKYPGSNAKYPGSNAKYPGSNAKYPGSDAKYPGSRAVPSRPRAAPSCLPRLPGGHPVYVRGTKNATEVPAALCAASSVIPRIPAAYRGPRFLYGPWMIRGSVDMARHEGKRRRRGASWGIRATAFGPPKRTWYF